PKALVTGYLIGDDSVCLKARAHQTIPRPRKTARPARRMAAVGRHYASTAKRTVQGHDVVLTCYSLLGRRCPGAPALYRQQSVCSAEGVPFASKIDLLCEQIRGFEPASGTATHVLADSWYTCKAVWRTARERGFAITGGLKSNRWLWRTDATHPAGGYWQRLNEYAASLTAADYSAVRWPSAEGGRTVYMHTLRTRVHKLYKCQVMVVRESLDGEVSGVRYWASSDLEADRERLVGHVAERWTIEVVIGDSKELGLDAYQVLSAEGIVRWWTLVLALYVFLEEHQAAQRAATGERPTIGGVRRRMQRAHQGHLLGWIYGQFQQGDSPEQVQQRLATAA
ncbi:MAG: transposase, partial [Chloroflexia bacterium]